MNTRAETLTPDALRERLVIVPDWIQTVLDRAKATGRPVEYESMSTPFGTYPIAVHVAEQDGP